MGAKCPPMAICGRLARGWDRGCAWVAPRPHRAMVTDTPFSIPKTDWVAHLFPAVGAHARDSLLTRTPIVRSVARSVAHGPALYGLVDHRHAHTGLAFPPFSQSLWPAFFVERDYIFFFFFSHPPPPLPSPLSAEERQAGKAGERVTPRNEPGGRANVGRIPY